MKWAPCALTQLSCPPGRTVSSRPIRSEQQGGACKVSRERAMGENVSIAPWDAAGRPDWACLCQLCCLWRAICVPEVCVGDFTCICGAVNDVRGWQIQHSRPRHLRVWPVGYTREKWALFTYKNCTQNTNKQINEQIKGRHMSLELSGCFVLMGTGVLKKQWKT